jgi:ferric-dicitrate binding protein FerR (iron transport regulator)
MEEALEIRIGRYLSGEMSGLERESFMRELEADSSLRNLVEAHSRLWKQEISFPQSSWDTSSAWDTFNASLPVADQPKKSIRRIWLIRAAAAAILFLGVYAVLFSGSEPVHYAYLDGAEQTIQLKDGTKVTLNRGSELKVYPFNASGRRVELTGEAFFDVTPDKSKPFSIVCGNTRTEIVGTSFNLKETSDGAEIFVTSGKIIFTAVDNDVQAVALTAGEAAIYTGDKMNLIANPSPNIQAWRTHDLSFIKMPLSTVVEDISTYFDQKVIIENDASKSCIINIPLPFQKPQIEVVLEAVAASINATLVQDNGTFIIRGGKDCQ